MKLMNIKLSILILSVFAGISLNCAYAQQSKTLLTVNGSKITSAQVDQWVVASVSEGAKDTPELRQSIVNDLVLREAVAQDAKKTDLFLSLTMHLR